MPQRPTAHTITLHLEAGTCTAEAALSELAAIVYTASNRAERVRAYVLIGDIAGRAFNAPWLIAARAAWVLLDLVLYVEGLLELKELILAMGRGARNIWLVPFVHSQLSHDSQLIVEAAVTASGGLCFPQLEETIAANFLGRETPSQLRLAAIYALGRMGASRVEERLIPWIGESPEVTTAVFTAFTEMRSRAGIAPGLELARLTSNEEVLQAVVRYLAQMGCTEAGPILRRLVRAESNTLRIAACFASLALAQEGAQGVSERIFGVLAEKDLAIRTSLARRLRTLPVEEVTVAAMTLFDDDPEGVVLLLGELRGQESAGQLLEIAANRQIALPVRIAAISALAADQAWIREGLAAIINNDGMEDELRVAAVHASGGFASISETFARLGRLRERLETTVKGALLWALQFTASLQELSAEERLFCQQELQTGLNDRVDWIRRRSAYVVGHLKVQALAPELVALAGRESAAADLRTAAFVGLRDIASPVEFKGLVALFRKEEQIDCLRSLSRTLAGVMRRCPEETYALTPLYPKIAALLKAAKPMAREAGVRLAGFSQGAITVAELRPFVQDASPRVREEALTALGRMDDQSAGETLFEALLEGDPALRECAAWALLALGGSRSLEYLLLFLASEGSDLTRHEIATRLRLPAIEGAHFLPLLDAALEKLGTIDAAYEPLLQRKIDLLEVSKGATAAGDDHIDQRIAALFPAYHLLLAQEADGRLINILRTAEALYQSSTTLSNADLSSPVVLWVKCLENFLHGALAPRLQRLQQHDPMGLFEHVDTLLEVAWPLYRTFLLKHWQEEVRIGDTTVEVPLRAAPHVLADFQERRRKRLDHPLSVSEWARLLLFFGVDHACGIRNLLALPSRNIDHLVRTAHRLQALAAVRNIVAHRAAIGPVTLSAFRDLYYSSFESLSKLF